jgi:hypothetical protein
MCFWQPALSHTNAKLAVSPCPAGADVEAGRCPNVKVTALGSATRVMPTPLTQPSVSYEKSFQLVSLGPSKPVPRTLQEEVRSYDHKAIGSCTAYSSTTSITFSATAIFMARFLFP